LKPSARRRVLIVCGSGHCVKEEKGGPRSWGV
jgi:hypothetical protein